MAETNISSSNAATARLYGTVLFAQTQQSNSKLRQMAGKKPTVSEVESKLGKQQSDAGLPIVEIYDLTKTAGEEVFVDCINIASGYPIMGDEDAEGKAIALSTSTMGVKLNMWTYNVSAGGLMSQQRTPHDLINLAKNTGKGLASKYWEQRNFVHLAGARGVANSNDWNIPLSTDSRFNSVMINPVRAPTFNRHYVVSGNNLVAGGQQLGSISSTDTLKLIHLDAVRNSIDNSDVTLQSVKLPNDMAAEDSPMWVMFTPANVYSSLLAEGSLRAFQQYAVNRGQSGGLANHPLFAGEVGMWNGILVVKMTRAVIRFLASSSTNIVTQANAGTATETAQVINAGLTAGYAVERCILVGAQALACAYGRDATSGYHYSFGQKEFNFGRNKELAAWGVEGAAKLRFDTLDTNGNKVPTDNGVIVIDVAARLSA